MSDSADKYAIPSATIDSLRQLVEGAARAIEERHQDNPVPRDWQGEACRQFDEEMGKNIRCAILEGPGTI